jgi:hypothetical protein
MRKQRKICIILSGIRFNTTIEYDTATWEHSMEVKLADKGRSPTKAELTLLRNYLNWEGFI